MGKSRNKECDYRRKQVAVNEERSLRVGTDLVCEFVFLLVVEGQLVVQDVVEIFLHECHGVGKTIFLVVSAIVHVGVITEDGSKKERQLTNSSL